MFVGTALGEWRVYHEEQARLHEDSLACEKPEVLRSYGWGHCDFEGHPIQADLISYKPEYYLAMDKYISLEGG